ncbi:class I SAM-dependent methyltransferase [Vineibacter terrae]|uniref:Class I SAM-dependent methyltransferase n=1 Tax=Vineibacter terrae TaxID=2586908 RepID=A0A5C8PSB7_9HYPH|nr:class I SAM-dependent methyltransferase [Vineibacter terrae]
MLSATLVVTLADGRTEAMPLAASDSSDASGGMISRFLADLAKRPPGHMLEVGSRARTGATYTSLLPPGWRYTGFDVMDGPNVDVVGDAHQASRFLPHGAYDAVMSFSVFEHLLMPWKAAIELNRVLRVGALGLIVAPQTWPLHEEPCDYFRFSRHAWKALFNRATGFEIVDAVHGATAYVVPRSLTAASCFGEQHTAALMASVIFRKVGETTLDWPVDMENIAQDVYPA